MSGCSNSCASKISIHQQPFSARDREKSFVGFFETGALAGAGTVNRPGRAQDASQVQVLSVSVLCAGVACALTFLSIREQLMKMKFPLLCVM